MNEARPDTLLKSALEKIVYFEARSEQIQNDLAGARAEVQRLKEELASAAQREIQLRRQIAEMEVTVGRAHRERHELGARIDALMDERAGLLDKMIDGARIRDAGQPEAEAQGLDLASFISELRSEVLTARAQAKQNQEAAALATAQVAAQAQAPWVTPAYMTSPRPASAPVPAMGTAYGMSASARTAVAVAETVHEPSAAQQQAERLAGEGRLGVSEEQVLALSRGSPAPSIGGRTEQTLFGFSVRELSAPDPSARVRAAERLRALGDTAAAPALATALHSERDPRVQVALLQTFAAVAQAEGANVAAPLMTSPSPDVRIAALKAMLKLQPQGAVPHLAAAVQDPDASVRRRASLLALSLKGEDAMKLGQQTTRDQDPEVRRLTALALGASGQAQARGQLMEFMGDADVRVRRAAAQSLGRLLGQDVSALVDLDDAHRRREVRRLATLPIAPISSRPAVRVPPAGAVALSPPPPEAPSIEPLCASVMFEIRCAIRGRTLPDLVRSSESEEARVAQACELLLARGQVVRRGLKYFTA